MEELSFDEKYKLMRERFKKEHSVICPHCGKVLYPDDFEFMDGLITYHAEDGPIKKECGECEEEFWVEESVDRTWKEFKTEKEAYE